MLHPTLLRADIYAPQLQDLSKHLDVIAVDLRGHGRSSPPPVAQAYDHASQLEEFLDALEIPSVDVLECFPERVGSVVLVNSSAFLYAFPSESYFCLSDALDRGGVDAARELWLQRSDYDFTRKNDAVFRFVKEVLAEYRGWHFTQDDRMTWRGGGIDGYSALKTRALIIYGEHCGPDYKAIAHQLDHVMEQGSLRCIPGCGMLPNLESIDVFNRLVLEFLSGVKGAA